MWMWSQKLVFIGLASIVIASTGCSSFHPSGTYSQARQSLDDLRKNGELPTPDKASTAVELAEKALARLDLKPSERKALEQQAEAARESFNFLEFVDHTWSEYGPGIESKDPYINETSLHDYLAAIEGETIAIKRPIYRMALDKHHVEIESQLNEISRRLRELERQYSYNLTQLQFDFVTRAANQDIRFARDSYQAGKNHWYWPDNKDLIARGLRPLRRVEACPRVHASLRADAEGVDNQICASLSFKRITEEIQKPPLPVYEHEINYPNDTAMTRREWVQKQWDQQPQNSLEFRRQ